MEIKTALTPELKAQVAGIIENLVSILAVILIPEAVEDNKKDELVQSEKHLGYFNEDEEVNREEF